MTARGRIAIAALATWPAFAPAGTLIVNVAGCFGIGMLMVLAQAPSISELARQLWVTGFLGALTTFSTFGWQTVELMREDRFGLALVNVSANCVLGLSAVSVGIWLGRRLIEG